MRIGFGYDSHQFIAGDHIVVGGVTIPFDHGLKAHSDGDVLLHALADALLGAACLGDLGQHFSDTDVQYKNISSLILLQRIKKLLDDKRFSVQNVDSTVVAEAPRMASWIPAMRQNIAVALNLSVNQISIKATTNETMGWIGRGEGLAAYAVVLINQQL